MYNFKFTKSNFKGFLCGLPTTGMNPNQIAVLTVLSAKSIEIANAAFEHDEVSALPIVSGLIGVYSDTVAQYSGANWIAGKTY